MVGKRSTCEIPLLNDDTYIDWTRTEFDDLDVLNLFHAYSKVR